MRFVFKNGFSRMDSQRMDSQEWILENGFSRMDSQEWILKNGFSRMDSQRMDSQELDC